MKPEDRPAFAKLLSDAMAFYRRDVSRFMLDVWWAAFERFELEQIASALTQHALDAEHGRFPPLPADITRKLEGTHTDRSLLAWGKVYDAMLMVGAYQSVAFDDGAIHAAISDMGGWSAVCRTQSQELQFVQKRFCELHRAYSSRPDAAFPTHLVGEHEASNRFQQLQVAPPVLVGNPLRAQEVMRLGVAGPKTAITVAAALPGLQLIGKQA